MNLKRFDELTERQAMLQVIDALDNFCAHAPVPRHASWRKVLAARNALADIRAQQEASPHDRK